MFYYSVETHIQHQISTKVTTNPYINQSNNNHDHPPWPSFYISRKGSDGP